MSYFSEISRVSTLRKARKQQGKTIQGIVIEHNVPIPPKQRTNKQRYVLGFLVRMDVGDSVHLPIEVKSSLASRMSQIAAASDMRFTLRVDKDDATMLRVWRVQ